MLNAFVIYMQESKVFAHCDPHFREMRQILYFWLKKVSYPSTKVRDALLVNKIELLKQIIFYDYFLLVSVSLHWVNAVTCLLYLITLSEMLWMIYVYVNSVAFHFCFYFP